MTDLIDRLSAAAEGSRELDIEIAYAIGWACPGAEKSPHEGADRYWASNWFSKNMRDAHGLIDKHPFTTSVDAALTLLQEGAFWRVANIYEGVVGGYALVLATSSPYLSRYDLRGEFIPTPENRSTPALALCIAALKACED